MSWTREQVSRLIDLYQAHPILYIPTHPSYYNKAARNVALEKISKIISKIRPNTTVDSIKGKINTLRSQFNKERYNLRKSQQSDASTDKVFKPTLWCFDRLLFLQDTSSSAATVTAWCSIVQDEVQEEYFSDEPQIQELPGVDFEEVEIHPDPLANTSTRSNIKEEEECWPQSKKRKRALSQNTEVEEVLCDIKDAITTFSNKSVENTNNEWEIFSKFICTEIQSLKNDRNKRILKREIIQCILKHQMLEDEEIKE